MTAELTSEEIVTKLLVSNNFVRLDKSNVYLSNPNRSLGEYLLDSPTCEDYEKPFTRYSFIDESLNWGF